MLFGNWTTDHVLCFIKRLSTFFQCPKTLSEFEF
jgi:hypothetical protein